MQSIKLWLFIKFIIVGFSGLLIDFGATYLLKEKLKINLFVANSVGFFLAASSNYMVNRLWTFESHAPNIGEQYVSFILVSIMGLILNNSFLWLFHKKILIPFYIAKFAAIVLVTFWNFLANYFFTFQMN